MNIMSTYNGYKNKDTWKAMLYVNNGSNIYETIYNMIDSNIIKDIIHVYIYSQLETDIKEFNLPIDINNISISDIYNHINLDVKSNYKIYT